MIWANYLTEIGFKILKHGDDEYSFMHKGTEIFRGTKAEAKKTLEEYFKNGNKKRLEKYLDEILESKKLDDFINSHDFKFIQMGYSFTHRIKKSIDGVIDVSMYIVNKEGEKFIQGYSSINNGILDNVFEVTIHHKDISTAMYKLLGKLKFNKVIGIYNGSGSLRVNYDEFIKVFESTNDKLKACYATPAGKALNKALDNTFKPDVDNIIINKELKKIIVPWIKTD